MLVMIGQMARLCVNVLLTFSNTCETWGVTNINPSKMINFTQHTTNDSMIIIQLFRVQTELMILTDKQTDIIMSRMSCLRQICDMVN